MSGATFATPLIFQIRSECSIRNIFLFPPLIFLTFPEFLAPGDIVRILVPRELILFKILSVAHCPIARRTTTEKTQIMIPSDESQARILFASIFRAAREIVRERFIVRLCYDATISPSKIRIIRLAVAQIFASWVISMIVRHSA